MLQEQKVLHVCNLITCEEHVELLSHSLVHSASIFVLGDLGVGVLEATRLTGALKVGNHDLATEP